MHDLHGLILSKPVLGYQVRNKPCVKSPRHVVPSRNRAEGTRVIDEPGGLVEAGSLGDRGTEAADRSGASMNHQGTPT
jgi:hypothetical protein